MSTVESDRVYATIDGRALRFDLYRPAVSNGMAVLVVHGGGWRTGDRGMVVGQANALAGHGFTCMAIEYRFVQDAPWPACLHDCKAALKWLRAHANELGFDGNRIGVLGNSAGGHLVLMLAATGDDPAHDGYAANGPHGGVSTRVGACIAVYPATQFYVGERTSGGTRAQALLGDDATEAAARAASPIEFARANFPPTFFLHGTGDKVVPVTASLRMFEALHRAGAVADMHLYAEQPHGWAREPAWVQPTIDEAAVFLQRYLTEGSAYAPRKA